MLDVYLININNSGLLNNLNIIFRWNRINNIDIHKYNLIRPFVHTNIVQTIRLHGSGFMSKTASVFCRIIISLWSIFEVESINFNQGNEVKFPIIIKIEVLVPYIQNDEQTYTYSIIIHTKQANYVSYTHIQRYSLDNYTRHYLY